MECFGTTDFDNNSRLITLSMIIISGLHCIRFFYTYLCWVACWYAVYVVAPSIHNVVSTAYSTPPPPPWRCHNIHSISAYNSAQIIWSEFYVIKILNFHLRLNVSYFDMFLTVHHSIDLFHLPTLMHNSFIH